MIFNRIFAMPNADTFSIRPIAEFVSRYAVDRSLTVDPFARNTRWARWTNDLNPATEATLHMDAEDACKKWLADGVQA
jgi:hypothetical protein